MLHCIWPVFVEVFFEGRKTLIMVKISWDGSVYQCINEAFCDNISPVDQGVQSLGCVSLALNDMCRLVNDVVGGDLDIGIY